MNIPPDPDSSGKFFITAISLISIFAIGYLDYLTGYEYSISVFYVFPIATITWYSTKFLGYVSSTISAIVWLMAELGAGRTFSSPIIPCWNFLIRLSVFIIIAYLLSALKSAHLREKELTLIDPLTGASNSRHFLEAVQMEISRLERSHDPFTVVYLDLDNFKLINDTFGHTEGDAVLKAVITSMRSRIRKIDVLARLGGDELGLLFPATNRDAAQIILPKIQEAIQDLMAANNWTVTFSAGVVTCATPPPSVTELIKTADNLMYSAKQKGKNMVMYSTYGAENVFMQRTDDTALF